MDDQAIDWLGHRGDAAVRIAKSDGTRATLASDQRDFVSIALGFRPMGVGAWWLRPLGIGYDERGLVVTATEGVAKVVTCPLRS